MRWTLACEFQLPGSPWSRSSLPETPRARICLSLRDKVGPLSIKLPVKIMPNANLCL